LLLYNKTLLYGGFFVHVYYGYRKTYSGKLIILRGNSGSGKTTVAKRLRERNTRKIALIEQDVIRREILREKEANDAVNNILIQHIAEIALEHGYDVILEGILRFSRYEAILRELVKKCPEHYIYYFDIPFEETVRRHKTKSNAHEFGEKEMRVWYKDKDITAFEGEKIIPETLSLEEITILLTQETRL
jgi:adenylate kinase family enzyme